MSRAASFDRHRPLLHGIARRMLGSADDADDVVQDAFLRWQGAETEAVDSPRQFLATVVTRLCLDHLKSARHRREEAIGTPAEDPHGSTDPADTVALADALSAAFFVLIERLPPVERAVFLLAEAFDFDHAEIATIVGRTEEGSRQILHRARRRLETAKPRLRARGRVVREVTRRFVDACTRRDVAALLDLLADDAVLAVESAEAKATYGRVRAIRQPIRGAARIASFIAAVQGQAPATFRHGVVDCGGAPAIVTYERGRAHSLLRLEIDGARIRRITIAVAPPAE